ncbi:MAG: DUF21 domain-containing protein [Proteobacteria bacterium]|nr:DUF21 domain-containing protein [Pseudomonadota bacterium]
MTLLVLWIVVPVAVVLLCSLLETTLLSVRMTALLERTAGGSTGAARLLEIKRNRIDDAISAILVLNTLAGTLGATLAGAQTAAEFGEASVGYVSATLTLLLLLISEIIPKTLATRYAGRLSAFTGHALAPLIWIMTPAVIVTNALIRLLARRPRERLSRREFALIVGSARGEGTISLAESTLIGNLIYSRDVTLADVMTPLPMIFMMNVDQTVADLVATAESDAFSRIPLFQDDRAHIVGYLSHRQVLKEFALDDNGERKLISFLHPIPKLPPTTQVGKAVEHILQNREALALVTGPNDVSLGLVTLEDLFETILGMEITDEAEAIAGLRPIVTNLRKHRLARLRRPRTDLEP